MSGLFARKGPQAQQPNTAQGLRIQTSIYGKPLPIVYGRARIAGNLIWYGDFNTISHKQSGGKGGGGGGKGGGTSYTYQTAVQIALCEGPIINVGQVWANSASYANPGAAGFGFYYGDYSQTPWAYLSSNHPAQALNYRGIAYVMASALQLQSSPALPQYSWEVYGLLPFNTVGGIYDANPSDVVKDLSVSANYGVGLGAGQMGDFTQFSNFCVANGIFVAPVYDSQEAANTIIERLLQVCYSAPVWSEGKLKIIPYSTESATGNGATYTPNVTPEYDLGDDDYITQAGQAPVRVTRSDPADAYNALTVECLDRANAYAQASVEWRDQGAVDLYGYRPSPSVFQAHEIVQPSIASLVAQFIGQRQLYVRNVYEFELPITYCLLEPGDLITLTDSNLGLSRALARITDVTEGEDGAPTLRITAEEVPIGTAAPATYASASSSGYTPNYNADPGNANGPQIFGLPAEIADNQSLSLGLAVSGGGANWGGCDVYVSTDNASYSLMGTQRGSSRMGVTTQDFPAGSDPDTVNTVSVDMSQSLATLLSGTQQDADNLNTLALVRGASGDEYISYESAVLTGSYQYNLRTYLRRGQYQTSAVDHPVGSAFIRIDDSIVQIPYTKDQIGKTLYIKLVSFNLWGSGNQELASVSPYTVVCPAPPKPTNVTGFNVKQNGNVVVFRWDQLADFALKGYDIGYAPQGTVDWSLFTMLTEAAAGTEMTNASVKPGIWTFGVRARDIADQLSPDMATFDLTVINSQQVIYDDDEASPDTASDSIFASPSPGWGGTLSGFVWHSVANVLIPKGQYPCSHYTAWEDFDQFVPDPVTSASYTTGTIDTGYDATLRVYEQANFTPGYGQSGTPTVDYYIDTWLTGGADPNTYTSWVVGHVAMRYMKGRVTYSGIAAGAVFMLSGFSPTIDTQPNTEQSSSAVTVPAGGLAITFPSPFHAAPVVSATATSAGATSASAVNVTATGFTLHVWTGGTDTGGTASWNASGE